MQSEFCLPFGVSKSEKKINVPELKPSARRVRSRVKTACTNCKLAKARCDTGRPCGRCRQRGLHDSCIDAVPKRRGRKRSHDIYAQGGVILDHMGGAVGGAVAGNPAFALSQFSGLQPGSVSAMQLVSPPGTPTPKFAVFHFNPAAIAAVAAQQVQQQQVQQQQQAKLSNPASRRRCSEQLQLRKQQQAFIRQMQQQAEAQVMQTQAMQTHAMQTQVVQEQTTNRAASAQNSSRQKAAFIALSKAKGSAKVTHVFGAKASNAGRPPRWSPRRMRPSIYIEDQDVQGDGQGGDGQGGDGQGGDANMESENVMVSHFLNFDGYTPNGDTPKLSEDEEACERLTKKINNLDNLLDRLRNEPSPSRDARLCGSGEVSPSSPNSGLFLRRDRAGGKAVFGGKTSSKMEQSGPGSLDSDLYDTGLATTTEESEPSSYFSDGLFPMYNSEADTTFGAAPLAAVRPVGPGAAYGGSVW